MVDCCVDMVFTVDQAVPGCRISQWLLTYQSDLPVLGVVTGLVFSAADFCAIGGGSEQAPSTQELCCAPPDGSLLAVPPNGLKGPLSLECGH